MGIGNRPSQGVAVRFADLKQPPPEAAIAMDALRTLNIPFDIQTGNNPSAAVDIFICIRRLFEVSVEIP